MPKNRLVGPKRWLFILKGTFSAEKLAFHEKNRLFGPKRWLVRWKDAFSAEKSTFLAEKSAFRAEKVTCQMKRDLFSWKVGFSCQKIGFSDEKVPFQCTHILLDFRSWVRGGVGGRLTGMPQINISPAKTTSMWLWFLEIYFRVAYFIINLRLKFTLFSGCSTCWCTAGRYFLPWSLQFLPPAGEMINLHATLSPCGDPGNHVEIYTNTALQISIFLNNI